jgi:hypothetical protein
VKRELERMDGSWWEEKQQMIKQFTEEECQDEEAR